MDFLSGLFNAASGIGNAIIGSNAANDAARAAQAANEQNLTFNNGIYGTAQNNLQPFVGFGQNAGNALQGMLGIGGNPAAAQNAFNNFYNSGPFQFVRNQGLQGVSYANAPNFFSGATGKALNDYSQAFGANQVLFPYLGLLQGQEGMGIQAGTNLGQIGLGIAGLDQASRIGAANARGFADLFGAGQWQNALGGLGNLFGQSSFGRLGNALGNAFGIQSGPTGLGSAFAQQGAMGFGDVAGLF